jgi:hypothetical protein
VRRLALPVGVMAAARLTDLFVMAAAGRSRNIPFNTVAASWDGTHYIYNAAFGFPKGVFIHGEYKGAALAFYPLYSLLLRVGRPLGVSYTATGLALSFMAALAAAALLWVLVRDWADRATADAAVVLFAFLPGASVLSLLYAEGVMLAAVMGCLIALHRQRWVLAGLLGAVATAARPNAIVVVACAAWGAAVALRDGRTRDGRTRGWRARAAPLAAPVIASLGAVAYHLYLWRHTGEASAWLHVQRDGWHERFTPLSIVHFAIHLGQKPFVFQAYSVLAGTAFAAVALVLLVRARPPATWLIWTVGVLFLVVTSNNLGARPRFVLTAFPLLVPLAERLARRPALLGAAAGVLGALSAAYAVFAVSTVLLIP